MDVTAIQAEYGRLSGTFANIFPHFGYFIPAMGIRTIKYHQLGRVTVVGPG